MPTTLSGVEIILNLRTREYEEFRTQALEMAGIVTPEWTDFFPHDPALVLVELFAGMSDILSYYIDRAVNEAHWTTLQLRQSVLDMVELIRYTPQPAVSATVDLDVTVSGNGTLFGTDSITSQPFIVGTQASTDQQQFTFEPLETEVITGGAGTYSITFIEGKTIFDELLGQSDGSPGQVFELQRTPVTSSPAGTPAVKIVISAVQWELVEDFTSSDSTDTHFTAKFTPTGQIEVRFGDGVNGAIPTNGDLVTTTYRIGGGSAANNLSIGRVSNILTASPGIVTSVTNPASPSGGDEAETVAEIKENAPKSYATQDRAVTHGDYEALARTFNGVYKAKAAIYKGIPTIEAVYLAVTGNNPTPSGTWDFPAQSGTGLLGIVGELLVEKSCSATRIWMDAIIGVDINIELLVHVLPNFFRNFVLAEVKDEVDDFVRANNQADIPPVLPLSGLMQTIENITGVDYVDVERFHRIPYIEEHVVGYANTTWSSVQVEGEIKEETWTIYMTGPTTFTVEGSVSGLQVETGTLGAEYVSDDGVLVFTGTAGSVPNKVGDQYRILTSEKAGNINFQDKEIAILTDLTGITADGGIV